LKGRVKEGDPLFPRQPGWVRSHRAQHCALTRTGKTEAKQLIEYGAGPADVGQGEVRWVVLADPEGNEFCVLTSR